MPKRDFRVHRGGRALRLYGIVSVRTLLHSLFETPSYFRTMEFQEVGYGFGKRWLCFGLLSSWR